MPWSDWPSAEQDNAAETSLYMKGESPKTKASKGHGRSKKKHGLEADETNEEAAAKSIARDVAQTLLPELTATPLEPQPSYPVIGFNSPVLAALGVNVVSNPSTDTNQTPDGRNAPVRHGDRANMNMAQLHPVSPHAAELRGAFSNTSPSNSPQAAYCRRDSGFQSIGEQLNQNPIRTRPLSMPAKYTQVPPLPHHLQSHFYGVHESDIGIPQSRSTSRKSRLEEYCAFDTLVAASEISGKCVNNILLVAFETGLMVYQAEKDKLQAIGRLEGLRGSVIEAKILPFTSRTDPLRYLRPLIAVIVHGPVQVAQSHLLSKPITSQADDHEFDPSASTIRALQSADNVFQRPAIHYQTTVEVYSLKDRSYLSTLFRSPVVTLESHLGEHAMEPPTQVGNLNVHAKGRFVIVSSGVSGEVYIFETIRNLMDQNLDPFKCIGKTWTSIPTRKSRTWSMSSTTAEATDEQDRPPAPTIRPDEAMVTLSHRWLAIVPPAPSVRSTLHGTVGIPSGVRGSPGLTSHTASSQPQITCDLDNPFEESVFNKVARDLTQEVIKGARWVGDQGMQVWKSYWNRGPDSISSYGHTMPSQMRNLQQQFPPTHAHDDKIRVNQQPTLVSILDLEKLSETLEVKPAVALQPVATFPLPGGCSFVSFTPSGLSLLTASAKGDIQYVWDLMRVLHSKIGVVPSREGTLTQRGPAIRQVARFTRMTVANIVDVVWTEPRGEKLAIVTDRGTVHVFDLPSYAFYWPPRRCSRVLADPVSQNPKAAGAPQISGRAFSTAINMVTGTTQPLLAAVRGRPSSNGSAIGGFGGFNITAGAGAKGGKLVASGISKSVGAATGTVNTIRHMGENRLHVPKSAQPVTRGCVKWFSGKDRSHIAVVGGTLLLIHNVRQTPTAEGEKQRLSVIGARIAEFSLPNVSPVTPPLADTQGTAGDRSSSTLAVHRPKTALPPHLQKSARETAQPLSFAEIETNAPYQPFHTDRRINLYAFDRNIDHRLKDSSSWIFGEPISTTKMSIGLGDSPDGLESIQPMENTVSVAGNEDSGQHVVVTTRRKREKTANWGGLVDEDFFEDDCDIVDFAEERV